MSYLQTETPRIAIVLLRKLSGGLYVEVSSSDNWSQRFTPQSRKYILRNSDRICVILTVSLTSVATQIISACELK